jgi:hypothetical protein
VDYVSPVDQDFIADIEEREKAGTPGVLQTFKAALALELKRRIGAERIEAREHELLARALDRWNAHPRIEVLGNPDPARRIGIVSFNLADPRGRYLHPKFVTVLLNDLFGIQSRAGCSCAGPYGHRLLGIDGPTSELYRDWVRKGFQGIKPGWCRVGFHYAMDDVEAGFVMDAVEFVAEHGHRFLRLYAFDAQSGAWSHREYRETHPAFSLEAALDAGGCDETALPVERRGELYGSASRRPARGPSGSASRVAGRTRRTRSASGSCSSSMRSEAGDPPYPPVSNLKPVSFAALRSKVMVCSQPAARFVRASRQSVNPADDRSKSAMAISISAADSICSSETFTTARIAPAICLRS